MSSAITETANSFHNSAKRQVFLEKVVDTELPQLRLRICAELDGYIGM